MEEEILVNNNWLFISTIGYIDNKPVKRAFGIINSSHVVSIMPGEESGSVFLHTSDGHGIEIYSVVCYDSFYEAYLAYEKLMKKNEHFKMP